MPADTPRSTSYLRTMPFREAILRYGSQWERTGDGAEVREKLGAVRSLVSGAEGGRELTIRRAKDSLTQRRAELARQIATLKDRLAEQGGWLERILYRDTVNAYKRELEDREARLAQLPTDPVVHSLNPDADSCIPEDAVQIGAMIWFTSPRSGGMWSERVQKLQFTDAEGVDYVTERGKTVRHDRRGVAQVGGGPEIASLDKDTAAKVLSAHAERTSAAA